LTPNKPPGGLQVLPRQAAPKKVLAVARRRQNAAGSTGCACGFAPQMPRGLRRWGSQKCKFAKARLSTSPHWPVDFCAPKRLLFGLAACGAWICRLRHLSFACACAFFGSRFGCGCLLFVRLRRSYFQCTSSEANRKQHAAVYLISICCSANGCNDQLLLLANGLWLGLLFIYLLPVDCVVIWSSSHCHLL
jgi:hypothetical protein